MSIKLKQELQNLMHIIARYPHGISLEELRNLLMHTTPKRTLQYRLASLIKAGLVSREGLGPKTKYFYRSATTIKALQAPDITQNTLDIPFSNEAKQIQKMLSTPLELRQQIGYRKEFLDSYEPNKTHYLSIAILEKLSALGTGMEKESPAGTFARKIYQRLLIDLSWNSSRLEGNTYSLLETERLLETGEGASGKDWMDTQMILNHKEAIEFIITMADEIDINGYTILNIHGLLSNNLLFDPKSCGRLRRIPVKIGKSAYQPLEVPQLIEEYFERMIEKASAIHNPFEQSFFLMVHVPYLQPFLDVNKRVSRLAGNVPLIRKNVSPLSFVDVSDRDYIDGLLAIYEFNRIELFRDIFVWAYERSALLYVDTLESMRQPDPFRMLYRQPLCQVVYEIVYRKMNKLQSAQYIAHFANEHVPLHDQKRFIQIAEVEVSSLHKGNFARFKIRPSEFFAWLSEWK